MLINVLLNSDSTPLLLFYVNGDYGYCYDAFGAITKVLLTGLTVAINLPKNSVPANHILHAGKYTVTPLSPEPF